MEQIRFVTAGDNSAIEQMKKIWRECFDADDAYLQLYFSTRYRADQTLAFYDDDQLLGMLTLLPCTYRGQWQGRERLYRAYYLFAVGTLPAAQGRQIATKLLTATDEWMQQQGVEMALLAPAEQSLYHFYQKRGYEPWFTRWQQTFPPKQTADAAQGFVLTPLSDQEYGQHHCRLIRQDSILWPQDAMAFAAGESRLYHGGIYALTRQGKQCGICYLYRYQPNEVIVKELLPEPGEDVWTLTEALRGMFSQAQVQVRLTAQAQKEAEWAGMARFYLPPSQQPQRTGQAYLPFILD